MYGLVNQGIKDLVTRKFGETAWNAICDKIQCPREFVSMQYYDDTITYKLVGAASKMFSLSAESILNEFGKHWVKYTGHEGYGPIMDLFGSDFKTCLKNLNHLHTRMGMTLPQLRPPSFEFREIRNDLYHLEYTSERAGLTPMVEGLILGLADKYQVNIYLKLLNVNDGKNVFEIQIVSTL